jgi:long-subunit acyl-CoA synthetase (AMP-forming)
VLDADGRLPTGDIATIDPDGCLRLVDRAKDCHQIRRRMDQLGGRRENAAMSDPGVLQAAVIGIAHPEGTLVSHPRGRVYEFTP